MECQGNARLPSPWCTSCSAIATPRCWGEHEVLTTMAALRRRLQGGVLQQAAAQLQSVQRQFQEKEAQNALTLLARESWSVTLQGGDRILTGTLRNSGDPADSLTEALCLLLAARTKLTEEGTAREREEGHINNMSTQSHHGHPVISWPCNNNNNNYYEAVAEATLRAAPGVTWIGGVDCGPNPRLTNWPTWSLELLKVAAPTLEKLRLDNPREEHLHVVHDMPRLRRLEMRVSRNESGSGTLRSNNLVLPALLPGRDGLRWLSVDGLSRVTLQSLLRAHGQSLEELVLWMGTEAAGLGRGWPYHCADLHVFVEQCGLRALRRLLLWRQLLGPRAPNLYHDPDECRKQCTEVRRVLPGVQVLCGKCDDAQLGIP
ncbi:uncharacterized protein LOC113206287 [Frankliniella occidentalis]|uniref:Uncharacterized protein LOC113206287 n=1 Tax=Frankliniella occidentalis TaxID=133901 RepID=A0A6J1SA64_FRAOC|nr:uncharacterized protein LOC113206287 [Frankliniella occidentalis]